MPKSLKKNAKKTTKKKHRKIILNEMNGGGGPKSIKICVVSLQGKGMAYDPNEYNIVINIFANYTIERESNEIKITFYYEEETPTEKTKNLVDSFSLVLKNIIDFYPGAEKMLLFFVDQLRDNKTYKQVFDLFKFIKSLQYSYNAEYAKFFLPQKLKFVGINNYSIFSNSSRDRSKISTAPVEFEIINDI